MGMKMAGAALALGLAATVTGTGIAQAAPVPGPGAVLTKVNVTFHTNDEDKDADTNVTLWVRDGDQTTAAFLSANFGHFDDHSDNGPFAPQVRNKSTWESLRNGSTTIRISPNGNDTWRFNVVVDLTFSDGSHLSTDAFDIELTEDRQQQTWGIQ